MAVSASDSISIPPRKNTRCTAMDRSRMNRSRLFSSFRANVVAAISSRSNRQSWHSIPYRKGFQPAEEFPFDCFGQLVQCYEPVLTGTELNIYRLNRSHKSRFTPSLPGFTGFTLFFFSVLFDSNEFYRFFVIESCWTWANLYIGRGTRGWLYPKQVNSNNWKFQLQRSNFAPNLNFFFFVALINWMGI